MSSCQATVRYIVGSANKTVRGVIDGKCVDHYRTWGSNPKHSAEPAWLTAMFFRRRCRLGLGDNSGTDKREKDEIPQNLTAYMAHMSRVSTTNEQPVKRIRQITSELSAQLRVLNDGFRPFHIDLQLVSLAKHLRPQVVQFREWFPTAQISFFVESPSPTVYLDHEKFAVAIENIVRNGIEAARDKITPKLLIRLQRVEDVAVVLITDNETGMDDETREHVFEPFRSTKSAKTNWGVGLNIAYRIIHGHDGSVAIRSTSNNGTTVEVSLPA